MPLIKRKPVDLVLPPRKDDLGDDEAAVYYIEQTGEIFPDYEDYVQRLSFYGQHIFQCELSGRIHLTFFEALKSERKESAWVHRNFPEPLKEPILRSVQFHVTGRIDELVDMVYDRFKERFFCDETVILDIHGDKFLAAVRKVFPSRNLTKRREEEVALSIRSKKPKKEENGDITHSSDSGLSDPPMEDNHVEQKPDVKLDWKDIAHKIGTDLTKDSLEVLKEDHPIDDYLYSVQLLSSDGEDDFSMALMERRADTLTRDRPTFSKTMLRKYLKDCVTRDPSIGSPWIVKPILAEKYNIAQQASEDVEEKNRIIKEDKLSKRRKYLDEENVDGVTVKKPRKTKEEKAKEEAERKEEEEKRKAEERRKKMIKYPIEDLTLEPLTEEEIVKSEKPDQLARRKQRPIPSTSLLPVSKELFEPFMNVYIFLQGCAKALLLSPFHLDEFEQALQHSSPDPPCHMIGEIHASLLNVIVRDITNQKAPTAKNGEGEGSELGEEDEFDEENNESEEEEAEEIADEEEEEDELDELDSEASSIADTEPESGPENEGDDEGKEKKKGEEVFVAGRKLGRGWESKQLKSDNFRAGWEYSLCGILTKRATDDNFPRGLAVLSHLTGVGNFGKSSAKKEEEEEEVNGKATENDIYQTPVQRYTTLSLADKVEVLQFLCEQAVLTRSIKRFFDQCEAQLTELRKERVELGRARRKLAEDRSVFEESLKKEEDDEEGGDEENNEENGEEENEEEEEGDEDESDTSKPTINGKKSKKTNGAKALNGKKGGGKVVKDEDEMDEDDDELASTGVLNSEDDYDSSGTGDLEDRKYRRNFGSRQEAMRIKAIEREAQEAERLARIKQEREEIKARQLENKQIASERKKLDDEEARITKREEAIEREFRQHSQAPRLHPLGRDRFLDKYWWFDGVGAANLVGPQGQIQYSTGRLFVQAPSEEEWIAFIDEFAPGKEVLEERRKDEFGGEEGILGADQWAVYTEPEEIDILMTWLRAKGIRELALRQQINRFRSYIKSGMQKRNHDLTGGWKDNVETRRSNRTKDNAAMRPAYMQYRNTFAKGI